MSKKLVIPGVLIVVMAVVATVFAGGTWTNRERRDSAPVHINYETGDTPWAIKVTDTADVRRYEIRHDGSIVQFDSSGVTRNWIDSNGAVIQYNSSGTAIRNIDSTGIQDVFKQDAVLIGTSTQLSTWSGQATVAGQSYYQTEAGKRYIVDPYALDVSNMGPGTFSGVTLILPDASTYPESTVKIELAITGATGWHRLDGHATGTTIVYIYPYSSATTSYNANVHNTQSLVNINQFLSGNTVQLGSRNMGTGISCWMLDKPGESITYALYNSQVSAYPVQWNLLN